jgi:hypothetical protein
LTLSDIYNFLETFYAGSFSARKMKWKFMFSEKERSQKKGKLILLVRLFHKIYFTYLSKIDTKLFPGEYATELENLKGFFADFEPGSLRIGFREKKIQDQAYG